MAEYNKYSDCPGPQSESAGKSDSCEGCPNQEACATAPKGPDPGSDSTSFISSNLFFFFFFLLVIVAYVYVLCVIFICVLLLSSWPCGYLVLRTMEQVCQVWVLIQFCVLRLWKNLSFRPRLDYHLNI